MLFRHREGLETWRDRHLPSPRPSPCPHGHQLPEKRSDPCPACPRPHTCPGARFTEVTHGPLGKGDMGLSVLLLGVKATGTAIACPLAVLPHPPSLQRPPSPSGAAGGTRGPRVGGKPRGGPNATSGGLVGGRLSCSRAALRWTQSGLQVLARMSRVGSPLHHPSRGPPWPWPWPWPGHTVQTVCRAHWALER